MIDNHAIHFIKLGKSLGAFMIASIGLVLIAGATTRVDAGMSIEAPSSDAKPNTAETCFTSLDDGATVFSSTDSSAIGQAINAASPGATIKAAGYCPGSDLSITRSLILRGGYSNTDWLQSYPITQPTTLDGVGAGQVLYIGGDATVTLQGLTISGGQGYSVDPFSDCGDGQSGGGIYNDGQLTVIDSLITEMLPVTDFRIDVRCGRWRRWRGYLQCRNTDGDQQHVEQ